MRKNKRIFMMDDLPVIKPSNKVYQCKECDYFCDTPCKHKRHSMVQAKPTTLLPCDSCNFLTSSPKDHAHHMKFHNPPNPFSCPLCVTNFMLLDTLKKHLKLNHTEDPPYNCRLCQYSVPDKTDLLEHYYTHSERDRRSFIRHGGMCPVCNKIFLSYSYLQYHRETHLLTPPYTCKLCGLLFLGKKELFEHHTDHVDSNATKCSDCSFKTFNNAHLKEHINAAHGVKKPFSCDICGDSFHRVSSWKHHQTIHGDKPYKCNLCNVRFRLPGHQRAHYTQVHDTYRARQQPDHQSSIKATIDVPND